MLFLIVIELIVLAVLVFMSLELIYRRGIGWDNLPEHINDPLEWIGKDDDDHWYTQWKKSIKGLFAYHWLKKHWFGSLRKFPVTLFAVFGKGESRWENDFMALRSTPNTVVWYFPPKNGFYLSRVQYYCQWHFQIAWPLFICFSFKYGRTGVVMGYIGMKRDGDCFWFPSVFLGNGWK